MARHGFGGADNGLVGMCTQGRLDRVGFVDVAQRSGRAMRIQVIHLVGIDACIAQGAEHGTAGAIHVGGRHVARIRTHAKATEFGVNLGATGLGVFVLFQHHHAGTFAQHKTIAVLVPGAGGGLGVIVAGGQGTHGGKTTNAQRRHRGLCATGHHHIRIPVFDHAARFSDAVQARCTGSHHSQIRPFEAEAHGHMAGHHIDDGRGHKKRRDTPRPTAGQFRMGIFDQRKAANARADHTRNACGELVTERLARRQARILHGLRSGGNAEMDESVHRARILGADVRLQVKTFDLPRDLAGEVRRIELGDEINAGLAGKEVGPGIGHRVTHGADATQAGHDNATTAHA